MNLFLQEEEVDDNDIHEGNSKGWNCYIVM